MSSGHVRCSPRRIGREPGGKQSWGSGRPSVSGSPPWRQQPNPVPEHRPLVWMLCALPSSVSFLGPPLMYCDRPKRSLCAGQGPWLFVCDAGAGAVRLRELGLSYSLSESPRCFLLAVPDEPMLIPKTGLENSPCLLGAVEQARVRAPVRWRVPAGRPAARVQRRAARAA